MLGKKSERQEKRSRGMCSAKRKGHWIKVKKKKQKKKKQNKETERQFKKKRFQVFEHGFLIIKYQESYLIIRNPCSKAISAVLEIKDKILVRYELMFLLLQGVWLKAPTAVTTKVPELSCFVENTILLIIHHAIPQSLLVPCLFFF